MKLDIFITTFECFFLFLSLSSSSLFIFLDLAKRFSRFLISRWSVLLCRDFVVLRSQSKPRFLVCAVLRFAIAMPWTEKISTQCKRVLFFSLSLGFNFWFRNLFIHTHKAHRNSSSSNGSGLFAFYCCTMSFFISLRRLSILLRLIFYFPVFYGSLSSWFLSTVAICCRALSFNANDAAAIFFFVGTLFVAVYFICFTVHHCVCIAAPNAFMWFICIYLRYPRFSSSCLTLFVCVESTRSLFENNDDDIFTALRPFGCFFVESNSIVE